ncbi:MAG: amino acid adenylation domain-containing protein [Candidatus Aminicenantes bacterium]|nr:MAG: amino acid adenylation domain-containing protein [Candidatus Aminicenantes bacterium]
MLNEKQSLNIAAAASQKIKERDYWLQKLHFPPARTGFPGDCRNDGLERTTRGAGLLKTGNFKFSLELSASLIKLSNGSHARLFMILAAGLTALISKYTGKKDIIVGTSIIKQETGLQLINEVLALRNRVEEHMTFKELILQVKKTFLEAVENQDYPYETLLYKLGIPVSAGEPSLFDIVILLESLHEKKYILHTHPGIIFTFCLKGEYIEAELEYNPSLYSEAAVKRIVSHLANLLQRAMVNVDLVLSRLDILSEQEKEQVLSGFNANTALYPVDKTIHQLFQVQVEKTPGTAAVVDTERNCFMCYEALNQKANQLAAKLRSRGVVPDSAVAIMVDHPIDMVVGLMAILKAGGAYLPLDPNYPIERKKYMLQNSSALVLLINSFLIESNQKVIQGFSPANIIPLEEVETIYEGETSDHPNITAPGNLAYILYTSGTTGRPKGVMIEHRSVVNLLTWYGKTYNLEKGIRVLQLSNYTFDPSVEDIFGTLLYGASLYIGSPELAADRELFCKYVEKHQVQLVDFIPTLLSQLLCSPGRLGSLEVVISGGETLTDAVKQKIIEKGYPLYNHYGPTETTVDALVEECSAAKVTIGRPIANVTCYILDRQLNPVPFCVTGELFISGAGVGRGYLNNPGLTAQKFIKNPFSPGKRMFRSGDFARWLPGGKIEFLGRQDQQIKIRGHRIELKEIENCLLKHPGIKETIITTNKNERGETHLCAYFVPGKELPRSELREYLSTYLPAYMIPGDFVQIKKFPLTSGGKVDRKSLPTPDEKTERKRTAPVDEPEEKMAAIWSEVLAIEKDIIGTTDNFFDLGGHSLNATIVISKIQKKFNIEVPLLELFKHPTIKSLAKYTRTAQKRILAVEDDQLILLKQAGSKNNLFLVHDVTGEVDVYIEFSNHLKINFNCWGIRANRFDHYVMPDLSIEETAKTYVKKIKKVQAHGPYYLAGWSTGGTIAFEILRQLEKINEAVIFFALVDTMPPQKHSHQEPGEFSAQAELNKVLEFLGIDEIKKGAGKIENPGESWNFIVDYLETMNHDDQVENIKKRIPENIKQGIPNFNQLTLKQLVYYFNVSRTFSRVCDHYIPGGKVKIPVHFFTAGRSKIENKNDWQKYSHHPLKFHKVKGDHYSIFKMPEVEAFAKLFANVLQKTIEENKT